MIQENKIEMVKDRKGRTIPVLRILTRRFMRERKARTGFELGRPIK